MEEEEALRSYCRRMISLVHRKHVETSGQEEREREKRREPKGERGGVSRSRPTELKERRRGEARRVVGVKDRPSDHRHHDLPVSELWERYEREGDTTSPNPMRSQGPAAQLVPPQLISLLKRKTFEEEMMRLAAEVELHDPCVCKDCEQKQASLALNTFIRGRKTQLEAQTLANRLNTHLCIRDHICLLGEFVRHLPKPSDAPHRIWEELFSRHERVTATSGFLDNRAGTWSCPDNR